MNTEGLETVPWKPTAMVTTYTYVKRVLVNPPYNRVDPNQTSHVSK